MADQKISQLSDGGASQATDEYVVARSGSNFRIDGASVAAAATSVGTLSSLTVSGDLTVDTSTLKVDSANNRVGIGTASPGDKLEVVFGTNGYIIASNSTDTNTGIKLGNTGRTYGIFTDGGSGASNSLRFYDFTASAERMRLDASGNLGLGVTPSAWGGGYKAFQIGYTSRSLAQTGAGAGDLTLAFNAVYDATDSRWEYTTTGDRAGRYSLTGNGDHIWYTASATGTAGNAISFTQAMTLDASGNLLVGATSPELGTGFGNILVQGSSGSIVQAQTGAGTVKCAIGTDSSIGYLVTRTNHPLVFFTNNTERARIDASGNLGVGTASPSEKFEVFGGALSVNSGTVKTVLTYAGTTAKFGTATNHPLLFITNDAERARITSGGDFLVRKTTSGVENVGFEIRQVDVNTPTLLMTTSGYWTAAFNRKTDDGDIVLFLQDNTTEGSISVSGNTVSYNAFAGSHWSQLEDGSKPEILRGTVMEALNDLCEWPGEQNERLPKAKVSDTAGSKKVYGVFMDWDNDWTATNDMYITAVGAFICRVAADVVVEQGDLLESNGDGTARVQADDVIRSSTIGKVTSTVKTHEYEDGTYCVPTVLYCG